MRAVLLFLLIWIIPPGPIQAAAPPSSTAQTATDAAELQRLIDTLKDPSRRAALITSLEELRRAAPTAPPPSAAPAAQPGQTAQPAPATQAAATPNQATPDNVGARLIGRGEQLATRVSDSLALAARGVADIPDLLRWLRGLAEDPDMLVAGAQAAGRLLCVVLLAFAGEFLVRRMTRRFYVALAADTNRQDADATDETITERAAPTDRWHLLRRLPFILLAVAVDVLPPLAFLAVATILLTTPLAEAGPVRAVTLAIIDAYVVVRVIGCVARAAFGAPSARLRLLPVTDDAARYLMAWVRRIAITIVFGYALSQLALLFGMNDDTQQGVLRLISLLVHLMLAAMVLRCRASVAAWIAGPDLGRLSAMRRILASVWHIYAIIVIAGAWIIHAARAHDDFESLIHFMLATIVVGLVARVADIVLVGALDRAFALPGGDSARFVRIEERAARYHKPLRALLRVVIGVLTAIALLQVWGVDALSWFADGAPGGRLTSSLMTLFITLGVAVAVWEAVTIAMQVHLDELAAQGAAVRAARLRTIVPLLRNALLITLMVMIALTAMSELGVNIGPLLAGASIFGVAIGFGSQKLVQDFITGIFLLLENAMQVGDNVTAGGLSGIVEHLSIRTLRLRAGDGSVHLIPFSSVSTVTNSNRGLGNASVSVTLDYEEDTDRVGALLGQIAAEMRKEEAFSSGMLSDLQLWGVDRVDGMTVTLAGQIVCTDSARWSVQREFNRRVKLAFQEAGIRMLPTVSVSGFRHPLDVRVEQAGGEKKPAEKHRTGALETVDGRR